MISGVQFSSLAQAKLQPSAKNTYKTLPTGTDTVQFSGFFSKKNAKRAGIIAATLGAAALPVITLPMAVTGAVVGSAVATYKNGQNQNNQN